MADDDYNLVFVVNSDGEIEKRKVETNIYDDKYIEILSGLSEGETVVIENFDGLEDGVKVEVTIEGDGNE